MPKPVVILGGGLAGISSSFHVGHERCMVLEKELRPFGHIAAERRDGYTWDPGPHVSFTKSSYVRDLFAESVKGEFDEYEVRTANYHHGHWIDHPAQSALYQVPEPLRSACVDSFLAARRDEDSGIPADYASWLERAFGAVFARAFSEPYTRKYWTRDARDLTVEWLGSRVFYPSIDDVVNGSKGPLGRQTHYITKVRYPRTGGFEAFAASMFEGCDVRYGTEVTAIDLRARKVYTVNGQAIEYETLINTLPLPAFIGMCVGAPEAVLDAARALSCSQLLLVNVRAPHPTARPENWIYVYDEDKLATRIHCTEKLTPANAPPQTTGVQVEVYFSRHRPLPATPQEVAARVRDELREMGLVQAEDSRVQHHLRYAPWANVIFDHDTRPALNAIWSWLEHFGLRREADDLSATTDWAAKDWSAAPGEANSIVFAGRFGQWKYFWTDDCVLRGRELGTRLRA